MAKRDAAAATPQPRETPAPASAAMPAGSGFCVVGIGASAGGLEACRRFLSGLPAAPGMAFILVQHLDPTHDSMMAELLASATTMQIVQARDGMEVAPDHLYLIPPGLYLAIAHGRLSLTIPLARHGTRLPFDFLLQSLAVSAAARAACVILSGGGADGAIGARAIAAAGGLVIAQTPAEAIHPSMPESAIATGVVDFILPAAAIGAALSRFAADRAHPATPGAADIIAELKSLTAHDFTLYKTGTMNRRIARRMSLAGFSPGATALYIARLRTDEAERADLVNDLLINVTSFFRDPKIFDLLAATAIPELVATDDGAIRVWVAGCSTGEETYSLAMLLLERMEAENSSAILQMFATDVDALAVAQAREGIYPASIEKDVSAPRLAKFFIREEHGYRVSPVLRACVVFAVQDVLVDPPFSKLNLVSCRNLLIYLQPEAQAKIIAVFNFALRTGGFLLLGAAEAVGAPDHRFEQISKPARLYRKLRQRQAEHLPSTSPRPGTPRLEQPPLAIKPRTPDLAETCRKLVLERYAPAATLINARLERLFTLGATDLFLRAAPGHATHDLLAQLPASLRARLREAVAQAALGSPVRVPGGRITREGATRYFHLEIHKVPGEDEKFLVCFLPDTRPQPTPGDAPPSAAAQIAVLETELALTRRDLEQAVHSLETAAEEHNAINEEALSANEEFQSTNEELLTSKEELQSLNEELTALNAQLQETLERSRMTSTDLRNVLYSTDVPTVFLDEKLCIRFFTPSATQLFHLLPSDVGRKLEDFRSLAADPTLLADAATVLATGAPWEREIHAESGIWYLRRIQAYRTFDAAIAGVVITFQNITERKAASAVIEAAHLESDRANLAKSRFLAAASHDLRQPLQSMSLIAGLLGKTATDPASQKLVNRLDHTMQSIGTMLNAMLDINQIEAGIVQPDIVNITAGDLLARLHEKFQDQAAAQNTDLRVVPCQVSIATDPALLEQMLTNLLGNALKYTKAGRVLLGCRRQGPSLRIEVWDSGIGIAADKFQAIFDEYHQLDNAARERSRGLGLGLSIVQRLGRLLGHRITVRSTPGRGSVFAVEVLRAASSPEAAPPPAPPLTAARPNATILLIEDDLDIRELLENFLAEEGFSVIAAHDAAEAKHLTAGAITPDLILADYNLPGGVSGLHVAQELRMRSGPPAPVIIMTGDISTATLRLIAAEGCVQMNKPMKLAALLDTLATLLSSTPARDTAALSSRLSEGQTRTIFVVDDDPDIRDSMRAIFEGAGKSVAAYPDGESFLAALPAGVEDCCLLVDAALPGISGLQLLQKLSADAIRLPSIMVTGLGDVAMAVQAMKAGAADFLEKPVDPVELLTCVRRVLDETHGQQEIEARRRETALRIAGLSTRQREVMERVLSGQPSKNIAADLGISQRTVENHRAAVMQKTGAKSIPALVRLAVLAGKT